MRYLGYTLLFLVVVTLGFEGASLGFTMLNQPSDLMVVGGLALILLSVSFVCFCTTKIIRRLLP